MEREMEQKLMNLGNKVITYQEARNIISDPKHEENMFTELPTVTPKGGLAYLIKTTVPLSKFHSRLDNFKFSYFGKGVNKEFELMKRYYHLRHTQSDVDKTVYNFQRHIYCGANDETDMEYTVYLVHYFGQEDLLQFGQYKKGAFANSNSDLNFSAITNFDSFSEMPDTPKAPENIETYDSLPALQEPQEPDTCSFELSPLPSMVRTKKRKQSEPLHLDVSKRKREESPTNSSILDRIPPPARSNSPEYLYALNMASQLQQLPSELQIKVKFQIATVFYEAEMEALHGSNKLENGN